MSVIWYPFRHHHQQPPTPPTLPPPAPARAPTSHARIIHYSPGVPSRRSPPHSRALQGVPPDPLGNTPSSSWYCDTLSDQYCEKRRTHSKTHINREKPPANPRPPSRIEITERRTTTKQTSQHPHHPWLLETTLKRERGTERERKNKAGGRNKGECYRWKAIRIGKGVKTRLTALQEEEEGEGEKEEEEERERKGMTNHVERTTVSRLALSPKKHLKRHRGKSKQKRWEVGSSLSLST